VRVLAPLGRLADQVRFELSEPPAGISIRRSSADPRGFDLEFAADGAKARPGLRGNLIVDVFLEREVKADGQNQPASTRRIPAGVLPAIPFEIAAGGAR
jgi:hypothetical protein